LGPAPVDPEPFSHGRGRCQGLNHGREGWQVLSHGRKGWLGLRDDSISAPQPSISVPQPSISAPQLVISAAQLSIGQENNENGYDSDAHVSPRAHNRWRQSAQLPGSLLEAFPGLQDHKNMPEKQTHQKSWLSFLGTYSILANLPFKGSSLAIPLFHGSS